MADEDLPPSYVKRCQRMLKKFNKGFKEQASNDKQAPQLKGIKNYERYKKEISKTSEEI
jgi:predicted secreted protein